LIVRRGRARGFAFANSAKYSQRANPRQSATARAKAIETARIAFAPRRDLFVVPSRAISRASRSAWSKKDRPRRTLVISPLIFATAFRHPRPLYRFSSPSRSSIASAEPVAAPHGTDASPQPLSRWQFASTVGRPLLST